jgi:cyanophycinase-like exopeptidase
VPGTTEQAGAPEQIVTASPGPVALVGSGEYLDVMVDVDRSLLAGRPPRAVFLPTAAAEEGEDRVRYWLELGGRHFQRLGVEPVPLPVLTREDASREELAALVQGAGLVYLSGGNPGYLASTLRGTLVWEAIVAAWHLGASLAGCSAGACALSYAAEDVRAARAARTAGTSPARVAGTSPARVAGTSPARVAGTSPARVAGTSQADRVGGTSQADRAARTTRAEGAARVTRTEGGSGSGRFEAETTSQEPTGLAVIRDVAVIPHYDRMAIWIPDFAERYLARVPPEVTVIGVDEDTAIVTTGDTHPGFRVFAVAGRQSAWVIDRDTHRTEYPAGSTLSVPAHS